jgi:AAA+ superfamily predicted ATPase
MNINFVETLINFYIAGNRTGILKHLEELRDNEEKLKHKKNALRIKNLLKRIPTNGYIASSLSISPTKQDETLFERISSKIPLENTILEDDAKIVISQFLGEWERKDILLKHNVYPANKLLFFGGSGTGKTQLAYGIANKLQYPLILVRLDEVISSYLGKTGKNIRDIFEIARNENVVLFLDEIDTLAKQRDDSKELGELKRVVTVLLQHIDRFSQKSILIGATNHESMLDSAIWRRFQIKLEFNNPSKVSRKAMFKMYLSDFIEKKELELLSDISENFTGASIFETSNRLKKNAILNGEKKVTVAQIISSFKSSINFKETKMTPKKRENIYKLCKNLHRFGLSLKDISEITNIPYTTLRDNIK